MASEDVDFFIRHCTEHYFAPGELIQTPQDGIVSYVYLLRQGFVTGKPSANDTQSVAIQLEAGDIFPVSAALQQRAVYKTYVASSDAFVLKLPVAAMLQLAERSTVFNAFLRQRAEHMQALSRQAVAAQYASQALTQQNLESHLGTLIRKAAVVCTAATPLLEAMQRMASAKISSIMVVADEQRVVGILTERDVLNKVALPQVPLATAIGQVMQQPVHTLDVDDTAQQAAMLMSRYQIRHVPITRQGKLVGVVSERDLFALQRLSMNGISDSIAQASTLDALQHQATQIRLFAGNLLAQGVHARQTCALISHLNDVLTEKIICNIAAAEGVDLTDFCWLALGSEGRSEQTIATDQDNALIIDDRCDAAQIDRLLKFANKVNHALDACGYPLCTGNIMASNPFWCRSHTQWQTTIEQWITRASPDDLMHAHMFFDARALAGNAALCDSLRAHYLNRVKARPQFLHLLAQTALNTQLAINWHGGIDTIQIHDRPSLDLKHKGTALFVVAARVYSLAHAVIETGTSARLTLAGEKMGLKPAEYEAWVSAFEFLQMLRLRIQLEKPEENSATNENPNLLFIDTLNDLDRKILKDALRQGVLLQQRLTLDYGR